jgi:hypothetical protein
LLDGFPSKDKDGIDYDAYVEVSMGRAEVRYESAK